MNSFFALKENIEKLRKDGWIKCNYKNYGDVGLKIEKLLNTQSDNFEIPDYNGIEIKTKKSIFRSHINLFSAAPDSFLFEIRRLHQLYSYPDSKNRNHRILNKSVTCGNLAYIYNNIYFTLKVNHKEQVISLIICDNNLNVIDNLTSWSFSMLKEKLERKLKFLCYIEIDTMYSQNQLYIKIRNDHYYVLKGFDQFIKLIEQGKVSITFKIGVYKSGKRKGQIHDHGTSFSIDEKDLNLLFTELI